MSRHTLCSIIIEINTSSQTVVDGEDS